MLIYHKESTQRFRQRFARLYGDRAELCLRRLKMMIGRYGVGMSPDSPEAVWDQKTSVLITYADMVQPAIGAPLPALAQFAEANLADLVSTIHVLPFFPSSSDDGFSVIDYRRVDERFGQWQDISAVGKKFSLMFDLVLNHCSRESAWFNDFLAGILPARRYFVTADPTANLSHVVRPRTSPLLTKVQTREGEAWVWTTFSADQVDLDFSNPDVLFEFLDIILWYASKGARILRLDAIAYLWKSIGTPCINLPETHEVVKLLRDVVELVAPGLLLLTETNVPHLENVSYFGDGDEANLVYQFALPPLILHALLLENASHLTRGTSSLGKMEPACAFLNFTASHDGIGLRPLEGVIAPQEVAEIVRLCQERGGEVSYRSNAGGPQTPYEVNISYFDALCENKEAPSDVDIARFLCSQAIPLCLKGIPAVYFNSLFGTRNDYAGMKRLGYPRAINRRKWDQVELTAAIADPASLPGRVFGEYGRMLRTRAKHAAFHPDAGQVTVDFGEKIFAVGRIARDNSERILALNNVSAQTVEVSLAGNLFGESPTYTDLLSGESFPAKKVPLSPCQYRWLQFTQ